MRCYNVNNVLIIPIIDVQYASLYMFHIIVVRVPHDSLRFNDLFLVYISLCMHPIYITMHVYAQDWVAYVCPKYKLIHVCVQCMFIDYSCAFILMLFTLLHCYAYMFCMSPHVLCACTMCVNAYLPTTLSTAPCANISVHI